MKFIISLVFPVAVMGGPINIFHESIQSDAIIYKTILEKDYSIPSELISLKVIKNCGILKKHGKLDLCLKNNGDLLLVSVDREFVSDSLKVFQSP